MFHTADPGEYLNRREFPIDYPAWLTPDGVRGGHDGVVDEALNWIQHAVYPHNVTTDRHWYLRNADTVRISAQIENPDSHRVSVKASFELPSGATVDSVSLSSVSTAGGIEWHGTWALPNMEERYRIKISAGATGRIQSLRNATRITAEGPVVLDHATLSPSGVSGSYRLTPSFRNDGIARSLSGLAARLRTHDPWVRQLTTSAQNLPSINPGGVVEGPAFLAVVDTTAFPGYINFVSEISEYGWPAWEDSTRTFVGVGEGRALPMAFSLKQNYPNPFNPMTKIQFTIVDRQLTIVRVFDLVGREVATIVNEVKEPGTYTVQFDGSNLASGVYFYRLETRPVDGGQSKSFVGTKKLTILR
jgi:hypothetical protein